ncbi:hypothetical protein [Rufibacter radiotolerans]|uniref:hypothetical protein n=1 Tax=Rufibacter radiotolerans TaxID=1379910 RepID=UPI00097154C6|nr:hypothetical protein [Rufibacter radiotolerans]
MFLSLLVVSSTLWGCSQKITVSNLPSLVKNSLQAKFPAATAIEWEKNGANYEAEFQMAQVEYTALYDSTGHLISYKQDILAPEKPEAVALALKKEFPTYQLDDLEKLVQGDSVYYQVELEEHLKEVKRVYAANGASASIPYWD